MCMYRSVTRRRTKKVKGVLSFAVKWLPLLRRHIWYMTVSVRRPVIYFGCFTNNRGSRGGYFGMLLLVSTCPFLRIIIRREGYV
jgi:hypothetical protein